MQAERELISRILQSQRIQPVLAAGVGPDYFHTYRPEFDYIVDQWYRHSEVPSVQMFKHRFPDFKYRKAVGEDPSVSRSIEMVRDNHLEVMMTKVAEEFVEKLGNEAPVDLLESIRDAIESLTSHQAGEEQIDIIADIENDVLEFERLQNAEKDGTHAYVPAPWEAVNDRWGGLRKGELIGVIARMGEGKSWSSLQMTAFPLSEGFRAFYAPLEMGRFDVAMRLHTLLSYYVERKDNPKFVKLPQVVNRETINDMLSGRAVWRNRELMLGSNAIDVKDYREWARTIKQRMPKGFVMPVQTSHSAPFTFDAFARHVERSEADVAVLDYLTLLEDNSGRKSDWEMWREITRKLKNLAMRLDIPVIVCAQANRDAVHSKTPELNNIAFSDALGQNADRILSLKTTGDSMYFTCIKNRLGENRFRFRAHFYPDVGIIEQDRHEAVQDQWEG